MQVYANHLLARADRQLAAVARLVDMDPAFAATSSAAARVDRAWTDLGTGLMKAQGTFVRRPVAETLHAAAKSYGRSGATEAARATAQLVDGLVREPWPTSDGDSAPTEAPRSTQVALLRDGIASARAGIAAIRAHA